MFNTITFVLFSLFVVAVICLSASTTVMLTRVYFKCRPAGTEFTGPCFRGLTAFLSLTVFLSFATTLLTASASLTVHLSSTTLLTASGYVDGLFMLAGWSAVILVTGPALVASGHAVTIFVVAINSVTDRAAKVCMRWLPNEHQKYNCSR